MHSNHRDHLTVSLSLSACPPLILTHCLSRLAFPFSPGDPRSIVSDPRRGCRGGLTEPAAGARRVRKRCLREVNENGIHAEEAEAARRPTGGARRGDGRGRNNCRGWSGETAAARGDMKLGVGANERSRERIVTGGAAAMAEPPRGRKRHVPFQDSASMDSCNGRAILATEAAAFECCTVRHTNTAL
jgi:hypothetical protein